MDEEGQCRQLACCRCHAQKLRCVRQRNEIGCTRCARAGIRCVPRPSKRVRHRKTIVKAASRIRLPAPWSHISSDSSILGLPSSISSQGQTNSRELFNNGISRSNPHLSRSWREAEDQDDQAALRNGTGHCYSSVSTAALLDRFELRPTTMPLVPFTSCISPDGSEHDHRLMAEDNSFILYGQDGFRWFDRLNSSDEESLLMDPGTCNLSYQPDEHQVGIDHIEAARVSVSNDHQKSSTIASGHTYSLAESDIGEEVEEADLVQQLALLNLRLLSLRTDVAHFSAWISGLRCPSILPSQFDGNQASQSQSTPPLGRCTRSNHNHVLAKTSQMALSLLRMLHSYTLDDAIRSTPDPSLLVAHKQVDSFARSMNNTPPRRLDGQQANRLLLISCYSRLLNTFCECFTLIRTHIDSHSNDQDSSQVVEFLSLALPSVEVAEIQLSGVPQLQALTVLEFIDHLLHSISVKIATNILTPLANFNVDNQENRVDSQSFYPKLNVTQEVSSSGSGGTFGFLHDDYATVVQQLADCKQVLRVGCLG